MKIERLNKFLFCLELETGGIVIGWLGIIGYAFFLIAFTIVFVISFVISFFATLFSSNSRSKREIGDSELLDMGYFKNVSETSRYTSLDDSVATFYATGIAMAILYLILFYGLVCFKLWSSRELLYGAKSRDHKRVLVYVVGDLMYQSLSGICVVISLDIALIVYQLIMFYYSFCTYSLYRKLEEEWKQRNNSSV